MSQIEKTAKLSIKMPGFSFRAQIRAASEGVERSESRRLAFVVIAAMVGAVVLFVLGAMFLASIFGGFAEGATRAKLAEVGAGVPGAGGTLSGISSVGANRTGAGGVGTGDVYVAESSNHRITEFSATGSFIRAFGYDVVSSGEHDTGADEVQKLTVKASGGSFALNYNGKTTGAVGIATWTNPTSTITLESTSDGVFAAGDVLTSTAGTGIKVGTTIASVSGSTLTLSQATEGATLQSKKTLTAHNLPYNASAAAVESALNGLSTIGGAGGSVSVSRTEKSATEFEYVIVFGGSLGEDDVATLSATNAGLEGTKTATVETQMPGGGPEVCSTISSPVDVCKQGSSSTVAGGLASPNGVAVDQSTGNVYVYGSANRVDVFSAKGAFQGGFGWNVISSGATGTGTLSTGSTSVTALATTSRTFLVGQAITGTGIAAGTRITAVGTNNNTITLSQPAIASGAGVALTASAGTGNVAGNEKQIVTVGGAPSGGTFTLTFKAPRPSEASATATAIPFNASAVEVQAKLEGLANIGAGNVEVTGPAGGPYAVEFKGARYADTNVFELTASGAGLAPSGTVTPATVQDGGALELCTASSGCLVGEGSASAGGFATSGTSPRNLSVDPSGKVYVPDPGNLRFDVFSPTVNGSNEVIGVTFVRAVGWRVIAGSAANELQQCTAATGCQAGLSGSGAGQFGSGLSAAISDPSGSVYAVTSVGNCETAATCRIQKFNPDGTLASASFGPSTGECSTVRTSGFVTGPTGSGVLAVAIDPTTANVFAFARPTSTTERVCEFDSSGNEVSVFPSASLTSGSTASAAGLVVGTSERVYAGHGNVLYILGPVPPPEVEILPPTEVGQTTAKLNGKVTVPGPGGDGFNTTYRFELSADGGATWSKVPASDVSVGSTAGTFEVHQVATGLQPNLNYLVRLVAATGPSATSPQLLFTTPAAAPTVTYPDLNAPLTTETTAKIRAFVNPNNSPTTYRFEWGTTTSYGNESPNFEPFIGAGGQPMAVSSTLTGLKPDTVYHYRLVATNTGATGTGTTEGEDRMFRTTGMPQDLNAAGLPDNRGAELVSPADKRPIAQVGTIGLADAGQLIARASDDGNSFIYPMINGTADSTAGGFLRQHASRTESGWVSTQLSASSLVPPSEVNGLGIAMPSAVVYGSPDLKCAIVRTHNPLTEDTPAIDVELGVENLYRWNGADKSYDLITDQVPLNAGSFNKEWFTQIEASDDCSRIYFKSEYEYIGDGSGLYEWDEGTLRDAGVLPNGAAADGAVIGGMTHRNVTAKWNAVSPDGSRLFFSAISNQGPDSGTRAIYMREDGGANVIKISESETGIPTSGSRFEAASPDGSHVFFKANYGIADTSSAGSTNGNCAQVIDNIAQNKVETQPCDLYDYDVETGELTDLSAETDSGGAVVQGMVAVDGDGSHVYFAALGQLVPGKGKSLAENNAGLTSANVYLAQPGGELSYVTTLGGTTVELSGNPVSDLLGPPNSVQVDVGAALMRRTKVWAARTSGDGRKLAFVSAANLTGYESGGAQEAYLYSADTEEIACISCRPDGLPSVYTPSSDTFAPDLRPPLERMEFGNELAQDYPPRSMSEDGSRIFFTSPNVLAPGAVANAENVYEWGNGQVYFLAVASRAGGGGLGSYLDSSPSGDDVFISTAEQLVPEDIDFVSDVYDFRVDGGFAPPQPPPTPCDPADDECQGTPRPQPAPASPPSATFSGPGNPLESKLRPKPCAKGKVRRRGKCVKPRKQNAKHRASRAANTNRGGAK